MALFSFAGRMTTFFIADLMITFFNCRSDDCIFNPITGLKGDEEYNVQLSPMQVKIHAVIGLKKNSVCITVLLLVFIGFNYPSGLNFLHTVLLGLNIHVNTTVQSPSML